MWGLHKFSLPSMRIRLPSKGSWRFFFAYILHCFATFMHLQATYSNKWSVTEQGQSLGLREVCDGQFCYPWPVNILLEAGWKLDMAVASNNWSIILDMVTLSFAFSFLCLTYLWRKRNFKWMVYVMTFTVCSSLALKFIGILAWRVFIHDPDKLSLARPFYQTIVAGLLILGAALMVGRRGSTKLEKQEKKNN